MKYIPQLFEIQIKEFGHWHEYEYVDSFLEACRIASSLTDPYQHAFAVREEYIRIVTPDNKIL